MIFAHERQQIIETCLYLQEMSYFLGTWGNVSIRVGESILLTPSRVEYSIMKPDDIVVIDMAGNKLKGDRNPTSEKEIHRQIYNLRNDVFAIIHAHTVYAMAVSTLEIDEVPCIVEEMSQLLGGSIPLTREYVRAEEHSLLGIEASKCIQNRMSLILRNHGSVACGNSLSEATLVTQVQEKACMLYLNAIATGKSLRLIPEEFIASEHYRYKHTYGKEKT